VSITAVKKMLALAVTCQPERRDIVAGPLKSYASHRIKPLPAAAQEVKMQWYVMVKESEQFRQDAISNEVIPTSVR
jgi:hypothetical protein